MAVNKNFTKIYSFEPDTVRGMSLNEKRDVMDEINNRKKFAFLYSLTFLILIFLYAGVKNVFAFIYLMREIEMLTTVSPIIFIFPVLVFPITIFADILKPSVISLILIICCTCGVWVIYTADKIISVELIIALYSFASIVPFRQLRDVSDIHEVLQKDPNYPDFFELPTKDDIAKK